MTFEPVSWDRIYLQNIATEMYEALRGLVALDHDSDDCAGVNDDCEVCAGMKAARNALAKADRNMQVRK